MAGSKSTFPCEHMQHYAEFGCEQHADLHQCDDAIILYNDKFNEYSIKHKDGSSFVIDFCPWCGEKLPKSQRDEWFDALEALGIDDPWEQEIPEAFKTGAWRQKKL